MRETERAEKEGLFILIIIIVFMQMGHPLIYSLFSFSIFYSSPVECYNHETTYCTGVYAVQYIKEKKKERSESWKATINAQFPSVASRRASRFSIIFNNSGKDVQRSRLGALAIRHSIDQSRLMLLLVRTLFSSVLFVLCCYDDRPFLINLFL